MAPSDMNEVIQHLRTTVLLGDGSAVTDGQLLGCFIEHRDEAAFTALVRRHGPMVWGVCRRLLDLHDAEDAFQATFLVLVRKATSIVPRERIANWLYGVARQTALHARRTAARRRARERQVTEMPEPAVVEQDLWRELQPVLDQELSRLPDTYREVIVRCDLEGLTRREAARQLGLPPGTIGSRLARARTMLARRLARHGLAVSGGALATVASQQVASASVPTSVVASTIKAASLFAVGQGASTRAISVRVAALTEGVVKAMWVTKIKSVLAVVLVIAALAGAAGLIYQTQAAEQPKESNKVVQAPKPAEKKAPPPATPAGKASPKNAKKEPDVLTPEVAIKQMPKEKLTVQFKVTGVIVSPLEGPKVVGYNEGPYIRLMYDNKFSVLLLGPASYQIMRLGIDPAKHFTGKSVRITGQVLPDPYQIMRLDIDPPTVIENDKGPPFQIFVDDLDHFEVVTD
jgi:RNA polymerase sigma factor (sigma-70 family)